MTSTDTSARPRRRARRRTDRGALHQTRVVLVDDCELVRHRLRDLLHAAGGFEVVGEAGTVANATALISATTPELVVLDLRLADGSGIDLCCQLRAARPESVSVVLTAFDDDEAHAAAVRAGAAGLLPKALPEHELVDALRRAAAGESPLDPDALERMAGRPRAGGDGRSALADLSDQQRKVVELVGEGLTNREIGERMHLAEKTIKNYVSTILSILGMQRRTEVAALAARLDERRRHSSSPLAHR